MDIAAAVSSSFPLFVVCIIVIILVVNGFFFLFMLFTIAITKLLVHVLKQLWQTANKYTNDNKRRNDDGNDFHIQTVIGRSWWCTWLYTMRCRCAILHSRRDTVHCIENGTIVGCTILTGHNCKIGMVAAICYGTIDSETTITNAIIHLSMNRCNGATGMESYGNKK